MRTTYHGCHGAISANIVCSLAIGRTLQIDGSAQNNMRSSITGLSLALHGVRKGKRIMGSNEICNTLAVLSTYQDTINTIAVKEMPIKKACKIASNTIHAWGVVMNEFNDVITTLEGSESAEDRIYRAAFCKALEIVMRANKYKREGKTK